MNDPVIIIQEKLYHKVPALYNAVFVKVPFTYVKSNLYFGSCSYCRESLLWPLLRDKAFIPLCSFLKFYTAPRGNPGR